MEEREEQTNRLLDESQYCVQEEDELHRYSEDLQINCNGRRVCPIGVEKHFLRDVKATVDALAYCGQHRGIKGQHLV